MSGGVCSPLMTARLLQSLRDDASRRKLRSPNHHVDMATPDNPKSTLRGRRLARTLALRACGGMTSSNRASSGTAVAAGLPETSAARLSIM